MTQKVGSSPKAEFRSRVHNHQGNCVNISWYPFEWGI